ncbi:MAG: Fur family transcriptional regulator [Actinomycetota bacterium]|nr:Fur family transcriptional regulator [Actinomycetota bacterium]
MDKLDEYFRKMRSRGFKLTSQRIRILKTLSKLQKHLEAEEIYRWVNRESPTIGLATVYRTLDLFADLGIVKVLDFGEEHRHYEISPEHHHHLVCLECGRVEEFDEQMIARLEMVNKLEEDLSERFGFKIIDHQLEFYGYCSKCRKIQANPKNFKKKKEITR